jgi:hypothetical protein
MPPISSSPYFPLCARTIVALFVVLLGTELACRSAPEDWPFTVRALLREWASGRDECATSMAVASISLIAPTTDAARVGSAFRRLSDVKVRCFF